MRRAVPPRGLFGAGDLIPDWRPYLLHPSLADTYCVSEVCAFYVPPIDYIAVEARGVTLGDRVFVGPHACFTNDLYPRAVSPDWKLVPTTVEAGASIGANSTILCGVRIGRNAMVAAGAVVTHEVPAHALVAGVPAKLVGWVCECGRTLDRNMKCAYDGHTYPELRKAAAKSR